MMSRLLGIDFGEKNIGLAMSDPLETFASPFKVIRNTPNTIRELKGIIEENEVSKIILGKPVNLKGENTPSTDKAEHFCKVLESNINVPVIFWDERLTTKSATDALLQADMSRKKRKKVVDKVAAVFILQSYIDQQKNE